MGTSRPTASSAENRNSLRSVHTSNFPDLLSQLGISLVVSTYQAGKVILVRNDEGKLNTDFHNFNKPMGIAADQSRLTIGGANTVWYYHNMPGVGQKLEPPGKHDACYIPRRIHVSGDIDIHELAWTEDNELWVVNTRFCCLCTLDAKHSFNPKWRPHFISALAPEDRCHLNGLAMLDGKPKYVTALGKTDSKGGWRVNKASGGILMDIDTNEILLEGLSMPHSPRWYRNQLWVLESGQGTLAKVDISNRTWRAVTEMPGFTRGIDFHGPFAFIGLSQVRESATFSGIPLTSRLRERTCGIWIVHIESGEIVAFLRFESDVQEIFAVQVLPDISFPTILEWNDPLLNQSYMLPDEALAEVKIPTAEEMGLLPEADMQRGIYHYQQGRHQDAIEAFQQCLAKDSIYPNARYNLGVALGDVGRYKEAVKTLQQVVRAEPEKAEAFNSLGYVCNCLGWSKQAIGYYQEAIQLQPEYAQAHFNQGMALLQTGKYKEGFAKYEWRWKTDSFTPFQCPHPQWDGSHIPDKTLLIHTEQGAGDAIQCARYLPLAAQQCAKLILICPDNLMPIFATLSGISELRPAGQIKVSEFDIYLPIMSLPHIFKTSLTNIPNDIPYFDMAAIRRRCFIDHDLELTVSSGIRRIGLVWAGSPTHQNDKQRSCPLEYFHPLLRMAKIEFYSLQVGPQSSDLTQLPGDCQITDLGSRINDFGDTAMIMMQLDLLISVDTAAAHLGGALALPVWTLLSDIPDWRWLLDGETTSWYPTMRLFRKKNKGDWAGVIEKVYDALLYDKMDNNLERTPKNRK